MKILEKYMKASKVINEFDELLHDIAVVVAEHDIELQKYNYDSATINFYDLLDDKEVVYIVLTYSNDMFETRYSINIPYYVFDDFVHAEIYFRVIEAINSNAISILHLV